MSEIRVRIAPSPSGYLHIGTARTALFNWLFARHNNGKFLIRIEDTDIDRTYAGMIEVIFESLKWLGLEADEPPIYQSQRLEIYSKYVNRLLETGQAYRCWCQPEALKQKQEEARAKKLTYGYDRTCLNLPESEKRKLIESGQPAAIRLFIKEGATKFADMVVGDIIKDHKEIDDFIIARSDGRAVYNMAVVVDDHEMGITHVIRGNDHISNTFKQILIYQGLELNPPKFAHIPLILGENRAKMSKRDGAAAVTDYGKMGYLKEAVVNFIALMGWSPGEDREIMTIAEMIELFSVERINPTNAIFDAEKLRWMNGEYIRKTEDYKLVDLVRPFLIEAGLTTNLWINSRWNWMLKFVRALKERCMTLTEFAEKGRYFFVDNFEFDQKAVAKYFSNRELAPLMKEWQEYISGVKDFSAGSLEIGLRELTGGKNIKPAVLIHPTRLALSGVTEGPPLFDIMELLGQQRCLDRLNKAIEMISKTP